MLFKFFEKSVPCYPSNEPALPPRGFLAFVWACARGVRGYVVANSRASYTAISAESPAIATT